MNATPIKKFLDVVNSTTGEQAKENGIGWVARCPAHDDKTPSLSITEGDDGRVLVHCHAGCPADAICEAVGLKMTDLMPKRTNSVGGSTKSNGRPRIIDTYDYNDENGKLLFQVVRMEPKGFRQRQPKPGGGWNWSVKGVQVVPYRLSELLAKPKHLVFVVEGEKDVDNLARIGVLGTCNAGGSGKWKAEHAEFLRGRSVCILADNDEAGQKHAEQVARTSQGLATVVRIINLPGLPLKGDASDWIAAGGTIDELNRLVEATPVWTLALVQSWPRLTPFDGSVLPEFPIDVLPPVLRDWVEAESHATQTPADLAGLLALAVCSAAIARRVEVESRPGWREPVNLFVAVLLEPGNRKSAVFTNATRPLRELEIEDIERAQPVVARAQFERRQSETRLKKLEKMAAEKGDAEARCQAGDLAAEIEEQPNPVLPRLIVDDATSEKIGMMLADQGGRIASMSPEGGVFDLMAGMYSNNGMPQFGVYLQGHSGDDLITDRVSRKSIRVERPALTCCYSIQPVVIDGLAQNAAFRGRGLLARFLYAAPQSWIGRREIAPTPVSDTVKEAYRQAIRTLAEVEGEFVLQLTPDALELLFEWETEVEKMLADGGEMEDTKDWGAKLVGATLRIAAVLHCVEHGRTGAISVSTLTAAVEIAKYLVPHSEHVLSMMAAKEGKGDADARYVLRWIERHDKRGFTKRDAQQHGKRRFRKADDIAPALEVLRLRGLIRLKPPKAAGRGRPSSPEYEVNPAVFENENSEKCSHNSQNSIEEPRNGNCENIESASEQPENENRVQVTI